MQPQNEKKKQRTKKKKRIDSDSDDDCASDVRILARRNYNRAKSKKKSDRILILHGDDSSAYSQNNIFQSVGSLTFIKS